jgi:putative tricarboxylic transport membrane protein
VWVAFGFGILAVYMRRNHWPAAPLILGFMLGPMLEIALRQTVAMGSAAGSIAHPFLRPIPLVFMVAALLSVGLSIYLRRSQVSRELLGDTK